MLPIEISFGPISAGQSVRLSITAPAGVTTRITFDGQLWDGGAMTLAKPPLVHTAIAEIGFTVDAAITVQASIDGSSNSRGITGVAGDTAVVVCTIHME
jgi:hypothetical protein